MVSEDYGKVKAGEVDEEGVLVFVLVGILFTALGF